MNDGHADRLRRGLKVRVPPFFDGTNALHTIWKGVAQEKNGGVCGRSFSVLKEI
jgi:hypothetical protein